MGKEERTIKYQYQATMQIPKMAFLVTDLGRVPSGGTIHALAVKNDTAASAEMHRTGLFSFL